MSLKKWLLRCGVHGARHIKSGRYLDLMIYMRSKLAREQAIIDWSHMNGIGV